MYSQLNIEIRSLKSIELITSRHSKAQEMQFSNK